MATEGQRPDTTNSEEPFHANAGDFVEACLAGTWTKTTRPGCCRQEIHRGEDANSAGLTLSPAADHARLFNFPVT